MDTSNISLVSCTKGNMTVTIINHIVNVFDRWSMRKGQIYYTIGNITVKSGYWMDFTEKEWNLTDEEYYSLPVKERMQMEAEQQHTYELHKQFNERFMEQGECKELELYKNKF